ncbi:MAG: hypothetical protein FK734_11725 [Asgard group archaeon]|nr:hypothetical protein [Asgard group archaeon]
MPDGSVRYCKFCGEQVSFIEDFNDYYCQACNSYQTHGEAIEAGGKKSQPFQIDSAPPPTQPPMLSPLVMQNLPMFRHRVYLVIQAFFSWGPKYTIYNVTGQKMGECRGKIITWGGEFDFFDDQGRHVAKIKGNPTLLAVQDKVFEVFDHNNAFRGAIKSKFGFMRRKWELYDASGRLIGMPNEQIWIKTNWQLLAPNGQVLVAVDKKWFTFRDQFRVVVGEHIDPLIALAYSIAIDWMYFRQKNY